MYRKLVAVLLLLVVCCGGVAVAQEVPAVDVAVTAVAEQAPWWVDAAETGLSWLWKVALSALMGYLMKKAHDNAAMQEAVASLEAGVQDTWVKYVKVLKEQFADGKWTDKEKAEARELAKTEALKIAKGAGRRLLVSWSKPYIDSLISKIVNRRKADKTGD